MGIFRATPQAGLAIHSDRRRHQRVKIALAGRYMLADHREFACVTEDMSPGGILLTAPECGDLFSHVIVYIEEIGRVEGIIARRTERGFAVRLNNSALKLDRLAEQLTWLANRSILGIPEDRRFDRLVPSQNRTILQLAGGGEYHSEIVDVSRSGVALQTDVSPPLGTPVTVGSTQGRVIRLFNDGVACEFVRLIPVDKFDKDIIL
jgi:hypothetical protein